MRLPRRPARPPAADAGVRAGGPGRRDEPIAGAPATADPTADPTTGDPTTGDPTTGDPTGDPTGAPATGDPAADARPAGARTAAVQVATSSPADLSDTEPARPAKTKVPLYPRLLRLRHVKPNAWQRAALGEGALGVAVLLVLADLATAWTLLALPVAVAVVVKAHDGLAGLLAGPARAPAAAPTGPDAPPD